MSAVCSRTVPAIVSAGVVLTVGAILIVGRDLGPLSLHMSMHIIAMNVAGPMLAALIVTRSQPTVVSPAWLWAAGVFQIAALWGAHLPSAHSTAAASHALQAVVHGILLLASLSFWIVVLALSDARRWHAVAALLLSGKLVCFLAVLLVFAPRALYSSHSHMSNIPALADQQLAGLLMIAACPLSYLLAAIIITVQIINTRFVPHPTRPAG
jgi:putative membrane protein